MVLDIGVNAPGEYVPERMENVGIGRKEAEREGSCTQLPEGDGRAACSAARPEPERQPIVTSNYPLVCVPLLGRRLRPEAPASKSESGTQTLPIVIDELRKADRIKPDTLNLLIGFGVGWSWAGCTWRP